MGFLFGVIDGGDVGVDVGGAEEVPVAAVDVPDEPAPPLVVP